MISWVVVPHRRERAALRRALASVPDRPAVVVDDGDAPLPDRFLDACRAERSAPLRRVRTAGGVGFARAVNAGLAACRAAGARRVLLLNDDAELLPGALDHLEAAFGPGVGAVGPLIETPEGVEAGIRVGRAGRVRLARRAPAERTEVDALSGACLLLDAGERLDPAYRHGMEDVDLCLRLRRRGLRVILEPRARCRHAAGATVSRRGPAAQRHAVSGHLRLVGGGLASPLVIALALGQAAREGADPARFAAVWRGWRDWRAR